MGAGSGMGHGAGMGSGGTMRSGDMDRGNGSSNRHDNGEGAARKSPDQMLASNPKLSSNLEKVLPSGITAQQACSGFKNLGQCVSAIHVSHNLGIPFDQLKGKLTGANAEKLGQAIHELDPKVDAKAEAKKAEHQAHEDMQSSNG
jgi:hypothetical protein